jgi:hypothetical protein
MPELLAALDAFLQQHRRCGDVDAAVEDGLVRMVCDCGAGIAHPVAPARLARRAREIVLAVRAVVYEACS